VLDVARFAERLRRAGQMARTTGEASMADDRAGEDRTGLQLGGGAIATIVGVGLLVVFMLQNTEDVTLDFLMWGFTWPLWLLIIVSAVFGAVVWLGLGVMRRHRRRKERRASR
jgi:uncharacterized integral membrane protein